MQDRARGREYEVDGETSMSLLFSCIFSFETCLYLNGENVQALVVWTRPFMKYEKTVLSMPNTMNSVAAVNHPKDMGENDAW